MVNINPTARALIFALLGYLSGSVLYARLIPHIFHVPDVTENSRDGNPGTANAYMHGGFFIGTLTLIFELGKGIAPVAAYLHFTGGDISSDMWLPLILAAPVLGHIFPVFFGFSGGKGIAVTFGSLLGLYPDLAPVLTLCVFFIFFSLIVRISPHFHRTIATYICTALSMFLIRIAIPVCVGFMLITAAVEYKMFHSREERQKFEVKLLWRH